MPVIWKNPDNMDIYHFPNDFNLDKNQKLSDCFIKSSEVNVDEIEYLNVNDIPNDIKVDQFEIFEM